MKASDVYVGGTGAVSVEVGDGRTIEVGLSGSRVFSDSTADAMDAMTNPQHALLSNNDHNFVSQGIAAHNTVVSAAGGT